MLIQGLDIADVSSERRNPILANVMAQLDYMEKRGSVTEAKIQINPNTVSDYYLRLYRHPECRRPYYISLTDMANAKPKKGIFTADFVGKIQRYTSKTYPKRNPH